jgi:Skp family chaperone for outer membrane proteins
MKIFCTVAAAVVFTALTVFVVSARKNEAGLQATQATPMDSKFAIVDTAEFGDPKTGVTRLTAAFNALDREMKPKRDELQQMQSRYEQLVKEMNDPKAEQTSLPAKADQAENLQKEIKRKQEDGQREMERRAKELTDPIYTELSDALEAYAKQRGVSAVFDISKFRGAMMVVNDQIDITKGFIADYNSKHPVTPPAAVPVKP